MKIRYLTLFITLIFLGFSVTAIAKGKPGGSGNTDEVPVYTAQLTEYDYFDFVSGGLTAARKGKSLRGNGTLAVLHNGNYSSGDIFRKDCSDLLTGVGVEAFEVLEDNWGISHTRSRGGPDQIHITMNNLIISSPTSGNFSPVDFDLHLHGEIEEGVDFLPESGSVSHTLTRYMLWAGGKAGDGWFICNSTGSGMETWEKLPQEITLTITRE